MKHLKFHGPSSPLYTNGHLYPVEGESDIGWVIKDNTGVSTNVGKQFNIFWEAVTSPDSFEEK